MGAGLAHDPGPLLCVSAPESRYLGVSAAGPGRARVCRKRYAASLARHIVPYSQWEGASIRIFRLRNLFVREMTCVGLSRYTLRCVSRRLSCTSPHRARALLRPEGASATRAGRTPSARPWTSVRSACRRGRWRREVIVDTVSAPRFTARGLPIRPWNNRKLWERRMGHSHRGAVHTPPGRVCEFRPVRVRGVISRVTILWRALPGG